MSESPQRSKTDWRLGALIGLAIGSVMGISKLVEKSLTPQLGDWGAFGVSLVTAGLVAGVFGILAQIILRKK